MESIMNKDKIIEMYYKQCDCHQMYGKICDACSLVSKELNNPLATTNMYYNHLFTKGLDTRVLRVEDALFVKGHYNVGILRHGVIDGDLAIQKKRSVESIIKKCCQSNERWLDARQSNHSRARYFQRQFTRS